jgi:WD40 repeat protein
MAGTTASLVPVEIDPKQTLRLFSVSLSSSGQGLLMTADAEQAPKAEPKARVFISYSRKDMAFADRLEAGLKARGFEPLIDRTEIYAFEDWWQRIQALISKADTIVFVLSPDAVASDICTKEVAFAASLNKRFAPVVCRGVQDGTVPEALRRLNYIFFDDATRFETSADALAEALQTDIGWIRQHTEFGEAARRWSVAGRPGPRGLLLRSPVLEQAERWIAARARSAPEPTEETQAFIAESRRATTQRRNIVTGSLGAGLLIALVLAGLAFWQRGVAIEERKIAGSRQAVTLAELATSERLRGNLETAMRLGVHAARLGLGLDPSGAEILEPRNALASAVWQADWRLMLSGHVAPVQRAAFSPDGSRIVTASLDGSARIWNAATGEQVSVLRAGQLGIESAVYSSDGRRIVTASVDGTVRIWDATAGTQITVLHVSGGTVLSAAFSPDGSRIVAASAGGTASIWNVATADKIAVLTEPEGAVGVSSAAFSTDGTRIVTASDQMHHVSDKWINGHTARIWDARTAKEIATLPHPASVLSAAFSPDGRRVVTAAWDGTARIWDVATAQEIATLQAGASRSKIASAEFSPDGTRIVTASDDKTLRIWDASTAKELAVLRGHDGAVNSAAFSPDGKSIVTASDDKAARVWDAEVSRESGGLQGQQGNVTSVTLSPDGARIVTASDDGTARIWDAVSGRAIVVLTGHEGAVKSAAFSPDGTRVVTASADKTARIWDAGTGRQIAALQGHRDIVNSAAFSPDGTRIVTASMDQTARIWDAAKEKQIALLEVPLVNNYGVESAAFSPDGKRVITASWDEATVVAARIWDAASGKQIAKLSGHDGIVNGAIFNRDGTRIVTASEDGTARLWNAATSEQIAVMQPASSAAFSADGTRIVTAAPDGTARIWDAASGNELALLHGPVASASFSPDATHVVALPAGGGVHIFDVHFATMSARQLVVEVCTRRLRGLTRLNRHEMSLAGYPDTTSAIDVCSGVQ